MHMVLAVALLFTWFVGSLAFRSHIRVNGIGLGSTVRWTSTEQQLIEEKLSQWRKLNQMGKLSKGTMYEEDVDELDAVSQLLLPTNSQHTPEPHRGAQRAGSEHIPQRNKDQLGDNDHGASTSTGIVFDIARRLAALKAQSGVIDSVLLASKHYALLCEVRDKQAWDTKLVEDILMGLSRIEFTGVNIPSTRQLSVVGGGKVTTLGKSKPPVHSTQASNGNGIIMQQIASYDYYTRWMDEGRLVSSTYDFLTEYVMSLYLHNAVAAADHCRADLLHRGAVSEHQLLPGQICASIHGICSRRDTHSQVHCDVQADITILLAALMQRITLYSTAHLNMVIRTLGRYQQMSHIFALLRAMKGAGVHINTETQEILTQCVVKTVSKAVKAESMSDLPTADLRIPEVVFVGRSNVGKSSLVNYLLNRKALAPTSATPGHTRAFHFYSVNQPSSPVSTTDTVTLPPTVLKVPKSGLGNNKLSTPVSTKSANYESSGQLVPKIAHQQAPPMFRLVDVPGLGYAGESTDEDTMQSWQSLLSRYMSRREPLRVVFHLIDSRHGVTPVDREMMAMACAAARERSERETSAFRYVFILTKADKVETKRLNASLREVKTAMLDITSTSSSSTTAPTHSNTAVTVAVDRSGLSSGDAGAGTGAGAFTGVGVTVTSALDRSGAEEVWELIHRAVAP